MKKWLGLFVCVAPLAVHAGDTGPEYLHGQEAQDPLSRGFILLKVPFEDERERTVTIRSFYQNRDYDCPPGDHCPTHEDWAVGGAISAISSSFDSKLKLGISAYTSQKLYADDDKGDTGSLQDGHTPYSSIGELYGSLTLGRTAMQMGRYAVELPYINKSDIRMTPQTFQGAQVVHTLNDSLTLGGAMLTDIKSRTRTGFDSLYEKAGLEADRNVYIAGALYESDLGSQLGVYAYNAPDFHKAYYLELSKRLAFKNSRLKVSGQYTRQESAGAEFDGDFTVNHYGVRAVWKSDGYSASLAYTDHPEESVVRRPWGSSPNYTSIMINDFDRAEESAWLLGGTVDLHQMGFPGMSVNVKHVVGDTPDCGVNASADRDESNLNLTYAPKDVALSGLVLQLRFAHVSEKETCFSDDATDVTEIRFVTNYRFDF